MLVLVMESGISQMMPQVLTEIVMVIYASYNYALKDLPTGDMPQTSLLILLS